MSSAAWVACLWVFAATGVAMLPMRYQFVLGFGLLLAVPVILVMIAVQHSIWIALLAFAGFVSMFRKPIYYYSRHLMKRGAADPAEKVGEDQ